MWKRCRWPFRWLAQIGAAAQPLAGEWLLVVTTWFLGTFFLETALQVLCEILTVNCKTIKFGVLSGKFACNWTLGIVYWFQSIGDIYWFGILKSYISIWLEPLKSIAILLEKSIENIHFPRQKPIRKSINSPKTSSPFFTLANTCLMSETENPFCQRVDFGCPFCQRVSVNNPFCQRVPVKNPVCQGGACEQPFLSKGFGGNSFCQGSS